MPKKKNVIFILSDQQHYRSLQANGCPEARTPNLDRLLNEGINFRNHYVVNPVCSPSRGAIWTGRYPSTNGLYGNGCTLPDAETTLPMEFSKNGFTTAHYGKLHLEPTTTHGLEHNSFGFDTCLIAEGDQFLSHDDYGIWLRTNHPKECQEHLYQMGLEGHMKAFVSNLPEELTHTNWVTNHGIDFINNRQPSDQPYLLSLGYFDPHHAWNPCEPYASEWAYREVSQPKYDADDLSKKPKHWGDEFCREPNELSAIIRSYHAMIEHIDANIGRLIEALKKSGELENTIIVFSSDHGEFLGNHGKIFKGPYLCDDLLRVPLIVWDGAQRKSGETVESLTSALDFYPTLSALAGFDAAPTEGQCFLDNDLNVDPDGAREHVISEWRMQPFTEGSGGDILSIRTATDRYVYYANTDEEEYYLHSEDPYEVNNLGSDKGTAERRQQLRELLRTAGPSTGEWPLPTGPW